ncbi:hypothetical protein SALBM135S_05397 [Streptomyces alboniger]
MLCLWCTLVEAAREPDASSYGSRVGHVGTEPFSSPW